MPIETKIQCDRCGNKPSKNSYVFEHKDEKYVICSECGWDFLMRLLQWEKNNIPDYSLFRFVKKQLPYFDAP